MQSVTLPGLDLTFVVTWMAQAFFLSLRIGAFLLSGPAFGGRYVPLPIRIMATMVLTIPLIGRVDVPPPLQMADLRFVPVLMGELAIGLTAGLMLTILFAAASVAGDRIANTAGLGFAAQFDPAAGGQAPVVAQLFNMLLLMVFISLDGHLGAFRIILDSYQAIPPGSTLDGAALIAGGLTAGGRMFALGMQIMLPVVSVMLLINVALGILTRSAPQLNVLSFGFPVTMTATIVLLYLTVPGTAGAFQRLIDEGLTMISDTMWEASNGRE